ncbi:MAG TPA: asparagine synthase (glutamine-hydrolyzing) [Anaerolineales bacterium]|nr:asparagine synthase (glutamine-hydrolyzing) [Anaerolineales bacterium]
MCGICGKVLNEMGTATSLENVARMNDLLAHRGPDDAGIFSFETGALGHRRLSIIDLQTGGQPMFNEDGRIALIFNGEIYNYRTLREDLARRGHHFRTDSDTEAIVHLYEETGLDFARSLRGMFALALWDGARERLVLARDRVGKKPLFYADARDGFIFASELKALLADPGWDREIDPEAIALYFELGYIPAPHSAFKHVRKLPPGSLLVLEDGAVRIDRYWEIPTAPKWDYRDQGELVDDLHERLREAVRIRLMSDVPLGAFLSGGIDSSLVVALMAEMSSEPVRTFAIGFGEEAVNELPHARRVAEIFGTDHTEFTVTPDAAGLLPQLAWHLDEPFSDASALPTYHVARAAREHVTVALNGDGGDELFGGYYRLRSEYLAERLARIPRPFRSLLNSALAVGSGGAGRSGPARVRRLVAQSLIDFPERYAANHTEFTADQRRELVHPDLRARLPGGTLNESFLVGKLSLRPDLPPMDRAFLVEMDFYLSERLLVKADRMAMANGLEARSPLLDQELILWAARLPVSWKLKGTRTKHILRELAARYLPGDLVSRPKQGFSVPSDDWFRGGLREFAADLLLSPRAAESGFVSQPFVKRLYEEHQAGARHGKRLWSLVMLELWRRQFVERVDAPVRKSETG